jgi:hypothetical protein
MSFSALLDPIPHPLAKVRTLDDLRGSVEAERAPIAGRVPDEDRDARIRPKRREGLPLRPFPPSKMIFVPNDQAALEREVWLAVV